jgi:Uma2 family endonuclease
MEAMSAWHFLQRSLADGTITMTLEHLTSNFPSSVVLLDPSDSERLQRERARMGSDRWDEVWEGTYIMSPLPNIEHQQIVSRLVSILLEIHGWSDEVFVLPGANITDREDDWEKNYRCPDVVMFLADTQAENRDTHWLGGPEFLVEVASPNDPTRDKLPFYAHVATQEVLIVDRNPWQLELLRLTRGKMESVGTSAVETSETLSSKRLDATFQLLEGKLRPRIEIVHSQLGKRWLV